MSGVGGHPPEKRERILQRIASGEKQVDVALSEGVATSTIRLWLSEKRAAQAPPKTPEEALPKNPNILIYDIETLPNIAYCWDTFSDRAIPLEFIIKPKSICTIAWKWYGKPETYVLVVDTPYDDKPVLEAFLPEWNKADYAVAHYSRFDKPFIAARLMANGLPSLRPVCDICTYKLAKAHFGRSLNGNKLDHLGTILGVGRKIKTGADLWVACANGDKEALMKMAEYNKQDVDLLAEVFRAMLPYVKSKLNLNLMSDEPILRCKTCGSDKLNHSRYEYTASSMRHLFLCDNGHWSDFPQKKYDASPNPAP
jgi:hypothetical protein